MRTELSQARAELDRARAALEQARREVEAVRAAEDRFLSSFSHELRTPLSAILLWTGLIEEEKLTEPAQLREALEAIRHSAEEQQALVENLVGTARILSGRLRLDRQHAALHSILQAALESVETAARQKQIVVRCPAGPEDFQVIADRDRLQQAFTLLLSNAVKFTPIGGRVDVVTSRTNDQLQVAITDTGAGLAREELPRLFDGSPVPQRVAARTECGLRFGLVVTRRIIEMHDGTIAAASAGLGQGATFTVRLPLAP